jgi:hypothetical protein
MALLIYALALGAFCLGATTPGIFFLVAGALASAAEG